MMRRPKVLLRPPLVSYMNVTFRCSRCEKTSRVEVGSGTAVIACSYCADQIKVPPDAIQALRESELGDLASETAVRDPQLQDPQLQDPQLQLAHVSHCLICPSDDLFVRKDFSQRVGVSIILFGFLLSSIALAMRFHMITFAVLGFTAIIDAILYWYTGNVLTCYRCHSEYRDVDQMDSHPRFDLEVHERYRQQAARQQQAEQEQAFQQRAQEQRAQEQRAQEQRAQEQAHQKVQVHEQAHQKVQVHEQVHEQVRGGQAGVDGAQSPAE
jgi:DNA-directed RNA polymerase subunit RPC12/RpoP